MHHTAKILLLGSGELGKEFAIAAKRLNVYVIAVDNYENAPAMAVADTFEVINMLDSEALESIVRKHNPDYIVPEIEAIRTEQLLELEKNGVRVIPTAEATNLTMNRDAIRNVAANELKLPTATFLYAESEQDLMAAVRQIGFPCVVKPVMSSSGKGQSIIADAQQVSDAWRNACEGMRGDKQKVIVETFIDFEFEMTLLTVKQKQGATLFVDPIGHRQESGDYRESWMPLDITQNKLETAKAMAKQITDRLGGVGVFGVEFFITKDAVIFSELSPRPHDTGMVTMISQNLSEFDLHIRAILGLPIPHIEYYGPSASAVILANQESETYSFTGLERALLEPNTELRLFGKPSTRKNRRMGVALARAETVKQAIDNAIHVTRCIEINYHGDGIKS